MAAAVAGAWVPAASAAAAGPAARGAQLAHGRTALSAARRAAGPVTPRVACSRLATVAYDFHNVPDAPTVILSAAQATYNGAAYCEVTGYITPQEQFDLKLPVSTYTGRYLQEGCGGDCGADSAGTPFQAANCALVTGNGLALGADNQGHVSLLTDGLWASQDPALRVSFGYASEHALAQAAKAIIAAYYGAPPVHSYFDGCSGGGREALVEAQRYPRDFNGILAGAPGIIWTQLMGVMQTWMIAVNMNAQGREILGSEKLPALHAAVLKSCGNSHGLITDPRSCDFNPAAIQCPAGADNSSCLTPAQVTVARDLYLGPHDGHGHYLYPGGEPYGSELAWADAANLPGLRGWLITPSSDAQWPRDTAAYQFAVNYLKYMGYWKNPPASFNLRDFRFTVREYDKLLPLTGIYNATDPDLSAFRRAGGKLIIWQGWADQAISPFGTVGYYKAVVRQAGGYAASLGFSRLYMIPGQYHCMLGAGGSPQVSGDLLDSLIRWAEQGTAPGTISFPLVQPAARLKAISVQPLNPLTAPPGGQRGLNTRYRWIGQFRPGGELWCRTQGMDLACSRRRPPVSYATDTREGI